MSGWTSSLAWSAWLVSLALGAAAIVFAFLNRSIAQEPDSGEPLGVAFLVLWFGFTTVGALIAARQTRNPIGWLLCALGGAGLLTAAGEGYALYGLRTSPGSLPGGEVAIWFIGWTGGPSMIAIVALIVLLFPRGRPSSARWRPAVVAAVVAGALSFLSSFEPGTIGNSSLRVENPFGIAVADGILEALGVAAFSLTLGVAAAGVAGLLLRLRRARGDERDQLKWLTFAGALFFGSFLVGPVIWSVPSLEGSLLWPVIFLAGMGALPISIGIAILRHRLYDIDLLINRTLVYGALTAALAATYFAGVVALQAALRPLTGGSELSVAGSTLAVVALFHPLRRRIQGAVDRRFYRSRYDAQRTLDAFGVRLRDQVDLDAVRADLLDVVHETLRPAHAGVWLREARR